MLCKKCYNDFDKLPKIAKECYPWVHCHHEEEINEAIFCKLGDATIQCHDFDLKIKKGWCKDCINYIFTSEKKEKCWCEYSGRENQVTGFENDRVLDGKIYRENTFLVKYCPVCGKKLL